MTLTRLKQLEIDTNFDFHSDSNGRDPDSASPTLLRYHKILWCKPLPNGGFFELSDEKPRSYLYYKSEHGEFFLGSDAITHSYKHHKRKKWLTDQIPDEVDEVFNAGSTIGAYILYPNKRIDKKNTINQARGVNGLIDDRFDLTLECIRRYYLMQESPLFSDLNRYKEFFDLFHDFSGYVNFFLLNDLVDESGNIKFYLPFTDFTNRPSISSVDQYRSYKNGVLNFIKLRNKRMSDYSNET